MVCTRLSFNLGGTPECPLQCFSGTRPRQHVPSRGPRRHAPSRFGDAARPKSLQGNIFRMFVMQEGANSNRVFLAHKKLRLFTFIHFISLLRPLFSLTCTCFL